MATTEAAKIRLTDDQKQQYAEQGYLVIPNILSDEEMNKYKAKARDYALGKIPTGGEKMIVRDVRVARGLVKVDDPEKGVWKLLNPDLHDDFFRQYPAHPNLLGVVGDLIGPDIVAFLLMMIYKPPGVEAVHPFHQDAMYFPFGPHDLILGTWVPLDKADAENGTLSVIPGSHRLDVLPHMPPEGEHNNFGVFGVQGYDGHADEVVLDLEPGTGVFFHSHLLHRTGANLSQRHRRVLTVHYASSRCHMTDGFKHPALDFRLVHGQSHPGCIGSS